MTPTRAAEMAAQSIPFLVFEEADPVEQLACLNVLAEQIEVARAAVRPRAKARQSELAASVKAAKSALG